MNAGSFGARVKSVRAGKLVDGKPMSVYRLADLVGVGRAYMGKVERGLGKNPGAEFVQKLAAVLGVTEQWLLHGTGPMVAGAVDGDTIPARAEAIRLWREPYDRAVESVATMHFKGAENYPVSGWLAFLDDAANSFRAGNENDPRKRKGARIATDRDD